MFVALKHSREVTLTVYDGAAVVAQGTSLTIQLGVYLHAAVATATPTSSPLGPGRIYTYDVKLTPGSSTNPLDTDRTVKTLASAGLAAPGSLLDGVLALGYAHNVLPGFSLPPGELKDLKLAHASCRKPHGPGRDALPILDTIIRLSHADPLGRPHQLFLTGDQIYADDVAIPLLEQLSDIGTDLLGWKGKEPLPPRKTGGIGPTEVELTPGTRSSAVKPPLTSGEAQCHLIRLGEFYAMYLFAWSDALWPETFELRKPPKDPGVASDMAQKRRWVFEMSQFKLYNDQVASVESFRRSLGKVRRALANVPSYMIFDDHEVTDDWYIHREQRQNLLGSPLATRLVTNALSAYSVFQAWGNEPDAFTPASAGGLFLSSLMQWRGEDSGNNYSTMCNSVGTASAGSAPGLRFDYAVSGPAHDVIVLDTRTRRGYPPGVDNAAPDLVPTAEIQIQLANRIPSVGARKPLTVLISAAPVFGSPRAEWAQQEASDLSLNFGATGVDRETWLVPARRQCFEELLQVLVPCGSILVLSGDVHYGFTCAIRYWDERTTRNGRAAFVQLVSSSLKNQSGMGQGLASLPGPLPQLFLGWTAPGRHVTVPSEVGQRSLPVDGTPAVRKLRMGESIVDAPQWRYRAGWVLDSRSFSLRSGLPDFVSSGGGWFARQRELAQEHRRATKNDQMRSVVGNNNVATMRFAATSGSAARPMIVVQHSLWYRLKEDSDDPLPYTIHWADLSPPAADDPRPDAPGSIATPPPTAARWADLISFRPSTDLQTTVSYRKLRFQPIEDGWGEHVNLDFYGVRVSKLPTIGGAQVDAKALLQQVRTHLNDFVDTDYAQFMPYDAADAAPWSSSSPYGCAMDIALKLGGFTVAKGAVVVTEAADDHWTFSTVWTPRDWWYHPVSGNRRFGFVTDGSSYIFFAQGADRTSTPYWSMGAPAAFSGGHDLWRSFQQKLELFVNDHDGAAAAELPVWNRYNWLGVKAAHHHPTGNWIP